MKALAIKFAPVGNASGFGIRYAGRNWLATCQHNLEIGSSSGDEPLSGRVDAHLANVDFGAVNSFIPLGVHQARTIVRPSLDGQIIDCAALEVFDHELTAVAFHDPLQPLAMPATDATTTYPAMVSRGFVVAPHVHEPVPERVEWCRPYQLPLLGRAPAYGFMFSPGAPQGTSGGPLLGQESAEAPGRVMGVIAFDMAPKFRGPMEGKHPATYGIAIPITMLLEAIDKSEPGKEQVVPVAAPTFRFPQHVFTGPARMLPL